MKLTAMQVSELKMCANSSTPLWPLLPPFHDQIDSDLKFYLRHNLVKWVGNGYVITPAGRQALKGGE
ncbi:hypothetical protein FHV99_001675 [Ochrobactrum sp. P20RRXII]|nr:hypothetical protein [Ochrobactrum sp. P20RRXII]NIH74468.1 hypothetical protein [Ochrobactrum sp. P20RRXII]